MSMNDGTSGPQAVLNFPRLDKLLIAFAKGILLALTGNKNFLNPSPSLIAFKVDIDAYDTAETLAGTNAKGTATQRNARRRKVIEDLRHLRDYVQSIVELQLNATDAAAMITTAGMRVRKVGKRFKAPLRARNAGISGTVLLDAKVVARLATYYWQYSVDQKVWTNGPETMKASAVISGLTSAQTYYFRFRALTRKTAIDFSQVVSLLVH